MSTALLQAMAVAVAGLSSLGSMLIVLLLLNRKAGPGSAFAFGLTYFSFYTTAGMIGVFYGADFVQTSQSSGPSPKLALVLCGLGVLMLVLGFQQWRNPPVNEGPPAFLAKVDEFGPLAALGVGLFVPLINFKNMAIYVPAMAILAAASMTTFEAGLSVVATTLVFCGGVLSPLVIYLLLPRRAERWLAAIRNWVENNSHKVAQVILPVVGCALLFKGVRALWPLITS